jgi:hypothetical protein
MRVLIGHGQHSAAHSGWYIAQAAFLWAGTNLKRAEMYIKTLTHTCVYTETSQQLMIYYDSSPSTISIITVVARCIVFSFPLLASSNLSSCIQATKRLTYDFHSPASLAPLARLAAPSSTPWPTPARPLPTSLPTPPVAPETVSPRPRPVAPTMPPTVFVRPPT